MKNQYQHLSETNHYQKQLIKLGAAGKCFVVACEEESMEPVYEGFLTQPEAEERAAELESVKFNEGTEEEFTAKHSVYQLKQDESGIWLCDYADIR